MVVMSIGHGIKLPGFESQVHSCVTLGKSLYFSVPQFLSL